MSRGGTPAIARHDRRIVMRGPLFHAGQRARTHKQQFCEAWRCARRVVEAAGIEPASEINFIDDFLHGYLVRVQDASRLEYQDRHHVLQAGSHTSPAKPAAPCGI